MAHESADNQRGIDKAGGIAPLITLLEGHPEVHRDVAGALWSLAADTDNQTTIAQKGGIPPLVELLKVGSLGVHETAAGALDALAQTAHNRVLIADAGGIPLLVALFDGGSLEAIEQASSALQKLVQQNEVNQKDVVNEAVSMLKNGSAEAQEHVTALLRNLAQDPENRASIAKAGAVPELVRQLEMGSEKAMGMAAGGLALIALKSAEFRATVTNELVKLLGSNKEAVRQRASEALTDMAADEGGGGRKGTTSVANGVPLVNLLKDGLKDGRVEAQEYALRSLLSVSDAAAKQKIVDAGCIGALIASLARPAVGHRAGARRRGHLGTRASRRQRRCHPKRQGHRPARRAALQGHRRRQGPRRHHARADGAPCRRLVRDRRSRRRLRVHRVASRPVARPARGRGARAVGDCGGQPGHAVADRRRGRDLATCADGGRVAHSRGAALG